MTASTHSSDGKTEVDHLAHGDGKLYPSPTPTIPEGVEPTEQNPGSPTVVSAPAAATLVNRRKTTLITEPSPQRAPTARSMSAESGQGRFGLDLARIFRSASTMLQPERQVGKDPGNLQSLMAIVRASYLNILLVFIPVSWALHFVLPATQANRDTLIFVFSFLAIIPLAKLLAFATEELSMRVGQTLAGLMNATLGNAVELIVAIIALVKCQLHIVQASLIGSVLSNLLLVLGMCFFAGGLKYSEQGFGASATQLNSSLLTISVIAVLLPAAFHFTAGSQVADPLEGREILAVSRGTSIILLIIYIGYLLFQLWSHAQMFQDDSPDVAQSTEFEYSKLRAAKKAEKRASKQRLVSGQTHRDSITPSATTTSRTNTSSTTSSTPGPNGVRHEESAIPTIPEKDVEGGSTEPEETPQMNKFITVCLLVVVTVLVAITAEWLVDSIGGMTATGNIHPEFVGIILLPIVGNAAEHVTAVTVAVKDKLNLSLSVAAGSSLQIALFVIPLIVTLGWILDKPMTLLFDPYESIVLFFSVLIVNYVVQDGKSNWLEGFLLMMLYFILALTFWFYPGIDDSGLFATCT